MRRGMGDKLKGFTGKTFNKLGGGLNVGMGVVGGAGRIAAGLASGEKASSAIGAGVGQAAVVSLVVLQAQHCLDLSLDPLHLSLVMQSVVSWVNG